MESLYNNGNKICFISRDLDKLNQVKNTIKKFENTHYKSRSTMLDTLRLNANKNFYLVAGSNNKDFEMAVNNKLLFLVPTWNNNKEDKALKYGIKFNNISTFEEVVQSLNNQKNWYYELKLPDNTHIFSLICAHSRTSGVGIDEKNTCLRF